MNLWQAKQNVFHVINKIVMIIIKDLVGIFPGKTVEAFIQDFDSCV